MIGSRGWYWIWIGLFVFFVLVNAISLSFLLNFKKRNFSELWQMDLDSETFVTPAGRMVFYEINQSMPKWVSSQRHLSRWYSLYRWSKRLASITFVGPKLSQYFCFTFWVLCSIWIFSRLEM